MIAVVRNKMILTSPTDLSHETRAFLITALHLFIEALENQEKELKKMEETLQLPIDSEKVRQLMAPMREKILEENKKAEAKKLLGCYKGAVLHVKNKSGEKQLSSVNVKLLYVNRSDPYQALVYEKKVFNRIEPQRPAV